MKKLLYLALCMIIIATMALCFSACGEDDKTEETNATSTTTTKQNTPGSSDTPSSSDNTQNSGDDTTNSSDNTGNSSDNTANSSDTSGSDDGSSDDDEPVAHTHTFDAKLSYDEENHYYAATCEHTEEKDAVTPHRFDDGGNCVCGYFKLPTITTIEDALKVINANRGKIVSGIVGTSTYNEVLYSSTMTSSWYEINKDFTHVYVVDDYINNYYFGVDKNGLVFGVYMQNGGDAQPYEGAFEDNLKGAIISFAFLDDYETFAYGANDFIEKLYDMALTAAGEDGTVDSYIEGNKYSFSFSTGAAYIFVEFTISQEGIADNVVVTSSSEMYTYKCVAEQYTENRTNPYDPDIIKMDSYKIVDKSGNDISETVIEAEAGEFIQLTFTEISPSTAVFSLSSINVQVFDSIGNEVYLWVVPDYDAKSYGFNIYTPGTYYLLVTVDGVETESTIEIALMDPKSISSEVYNSSFGIFEEKNSVTAYVGKDVNFRSLVEEHCDGAYFAEILGDVDESIAFLTEGDIDGEAIQIFKAFEIGTYEIKLTSTVKEELSCILTVDVVEAPDVAEMLKGYFVGVNEFAEECSTATFVDNTIEVTYFEMVEVISFTYENGVISFEHVSGDEIIFDVFVSDNYELTMEINGYNVVFTEAEVPVFIDPSLEGNKGVITIVDMINNNNKYSGTYTYEIIDGEFTFYKNGEVTTEINITTDRGGNFLLTWPGSLVAQEMIKISGEDGLFGGVYKTEVMVGVLMTAAEITIDPISPAEDESNYTGKIIVEDLNGNVCSGTYLYNLKDDGYLEIYKDGVLTNAIIIMPNNAGKYTFQGGRLASPQLMVKNSGDENALAGTYVVSFFGSVLYNIQITGGATEEVEPTVPTVQEIEGTIWKCMDLTIQFTTVDEFYFTNDAKDFEVYGKFTLNDEGVFAFDIDEENSVNMNMAPDLSFSTVKLMGTTIQIIDIIANMVFEKVE